MKYYAQFYQLSTGYISGTIPPQFGQPKPIPACGDRAIIQIDGRLSKRAMGDIAAMECAKRGYIAWQIIAGDSLLTAKPQHGPNFVHTGKIDNSAMSATYGA